MMGGMSRQDENDPISTDGTYEDLIELSFNDSCTEAFYSDSELKRKIQMADQSFIMNKLDVALDLYTQVFDHLEQNFNQHNQLAGDVSVKISNIFLGKGEKLGGRNFLAKALTHLRKARDAYKECLEVNDPEEGDNDDKRRREILSLKLLETSFAIANVHMELNEIDKAQETYKDAIQLCRDLCLAADKLSAALLNYGNFLSVCKQDFNGAIDVMKEILKLHLKASNGLMNSYSASTLSCMGKVFLRRSKTAKPEEVVKDAKRAEACFLRALKLYRLSMISNGNEKVVDTLCYLSEAREKQGNFKPKSSLRRVRWLDQNDSEESSTGLDQTRCCYPTFSLGNFYGSEKDEEDDDDDEERDEFD